MHRWRCRSNLCLADGIYQGKHHGPQSETNTFLANGPSFFCHTWPVLLDRRVLQTQLQLQSKIKGVKLPYNGMYSGLIYTVQTTGFLSLYRGLAPTLIGSVPKAGIRFGLNAVIKESLRDKNGNLTPAKNFVAGLGAGVAEA